jgi:hypothetical protein
MAANYPLSNPLYSRYQETIIRINEGMIAESRFSKAETQSLNKEIVESLVNLHEATSDPFYYYRIGQRYLKMQKNFEAQKYFRLAYVHAPANAYYRDAAKQLSDNLKQ